MNKLDYSKYSYAFDSVDELIAEASKPPTDKKQTVAESTKPFYGGTLSQAVKLAQEGWHGAPDLGAACQGIISATLADAKEMTVASVSGAFLDIGAFVSGEPECFQEFAPVEQPRAIRIGANITANAKVTKQQKIYRGAVMMAVCETLQKSGVSVEVIGVILNKGFQEGAEELLTFPLKRPDERVDENQLAYWLCHDSAFRQIYFSYQDTRSEGYAKDFKISRLRGKTLTDTAANVGVDYLFSGHANPKNQGEAIALYHSAIKAIEATLAK